MGLFNYSKEGPGIEKDAPKKKTFFVFFETFFRNFWKFMPINFLYCIIAIPVFTIGIANAGITNVARNTARDKHSFGVSDFLDTIKANWKQALPVGIINTIVYSVLIFNCFFFYIYLNSFGYLSPIGLGITIVTLFLFYVMNFYIWTLMITFNFPIKTLYSNSFKFFFLNLKNNILCSISMLISTLVFVGIYLALSALKNVVFGAILSIIFAMLVLPLCKFLIIQYNVFPTIKRYIIDPYYNEHPNDDIEQRENLGIETKIEQEIEE